MSNRISDQCLAKLLLVSPSGLENALFGYLQAERDHSKDLENKLINAEHNAKHLLEKIRLLQERIAELLSKRKDG